MGLAGECNGFLVGAVDDKTSAPCSTRPKTAARAAPPAPRTTMRAPLRRMRFSRGLMTPATSGVEAVDLAVGAGF